ncbi:PHB depolymerase family esterase [soil metagenome]
MHRRVVALLILASCDSSSAVGPQDDAGTVGDAVPDVAPDARVCGQRGGARGLTMRQVTAGGLARTYRVYLPPGSASEPMPLVIVHHGYTMSGQAMFDITGYAALADSEHIALAFPDGQGGPNSFGAPWNVGTNVCPSTSGAPPLATGDDFALLDAIEADVDQDQCLDRAHMFATGFSMGGYFSHHIGCMRPDIRAVAPHSGGTHELSGCVNARRPIIMFHGTSDTLIAPGCQDPASAPVGSTVPAATAWAAHNGCSTTTTSRMVAGGTCIHYEGCPADGQVELCTFSGMAHCWAGGAAGAGVFSCPAYAAATQLEWAFFKTYAW